MLLDLRVSLGEDEGVVGVGLEEQGQLFEQLVLLMLGC